MKSDEEDEDGEDEEEGVCDVKEINMDFRYTRLFSSVHSTYQLLKHKANNCQLLLYDGKNIYDYNYRKQREISKINFYTCSNQKIAINATYVNKFKVKIEGEKGEKERELVLLP